MKITVALLLVVLALAGCSQPFDDYGDYTPSPGRADPSANIVITSTKESGDYLYIYYTIENKNTYKWDYFEVYFDIETTNGRVDTYDNGLDLKAGDTVSGWTIEKIGAGTFISVEVASLKVLVN